MVRSEENKVAFESLIKNIDYYLSHAIKEAQLYDDQRMVPVLSRLRDHHIYHHSVCTDLYRTYKGDESSK